MARTPAATRGEVQGIGSKMGKIYIKGDDGNYYRLVVKTSNNPKLDVELHSSEPPDDGIVCNE